MGYIDQATATLVINVAMYVYLGVLIGMVWGMKLILDRKFQVMEWAKEVDEPGSWVNPNFDLEICDDQSSWDLEIEVYEETEAQGYCNNAWACAACASAVAASPCRTSVRFSRSLTMSILSRNASARRTPS